MNFQANSFIENHKNSFVRETLGKQNSSNIPCYSIIRIGWPLMRVLYKQENEGKAIENEGININ